LLPDDLAVGRVETVEVAERPERVDPAFINDWRRPRTIRVTQLDVRTVVRMFPDLLAGLHVEAEHAFLARHRGAGEGVLQRRFVGLAVHDVEPVADNGGAGVARADRLPPADCQPALGELLEDAFLAPDRVALRAEPLRPVVAARGKRGEGDSNKSEQRAS